MIEITLPSFELQYNKQHLRAVLKAAGKEVVATARGLIQATGKTSAPGQAPTSRTGALAKSMRVRASTTSVTIIDTVPYAAALEGGAVGGGGKGSASVGRSHKRGGPKGKPMTVRMLAPRPFLSTAMATDWPDIETRIEKSVELDIDFIEKSP